MLFRSVMLMVKAGVAVDEFIAHLAPLLSQGDIIIDGGNSHPADSTRRTRELAELDKRGVKFVAQSAEASRRFIEGARGASLTRMKERMEKAGGMENYDRMVKLHSGS